MVAKDIHLPVRVLGEAFCFAFDNSGSVLWRSRPRHHFLDHRTCAAWNTRWAQTAAFTADNGRGYRTTVLTYRGQEFRLQLHRAIFAAWTGVWPSNLVDHRDGDTGNYSPENLRDATDSENMQNAAGWSHNTSGANGVYWFPPRSCWCARIGFGGRQISLGYWPTKELAAAARKGAEKALGFQDRHGERT